MAVLREPKVCKRCEREWTPRRSDAGDYCPGSCQEAAAKKAKRGCEAIQAELLELGAQERVSGRLGDCYTHTAWQPDADIERDRAHDAEYVAPPKGDTGGELRPCEWCNEPIVSVRSDPKRFCDKPKPCKRLYNEAKNRQRRDYRGSQPWKLRHDDERHAAGPLGPERPADSTFKTTGPLTLNASEVVKEQKLSKRAAFEARVYAAAARRRSRDEENIAVELPPEPKFSGKGNFGPPAHELTFGMHIGRARAELEELEARGPRSAEIIPLPTSAPAAAAAAKRAAA